MGAKLGSAILKGNTTNVPGPGNYAHDADAIQEKAPKFGFGSMKRPEMAAKSNKAIPGPGAHSPEFSKLKNKAPNYGFGSEVRSQKEIDRKKYIPGAGTYQLPAKTGNEGRHHTMHSTIEYSPEKKENSYKPGPGNYSPDKSSAIKQEPQYKIGTGQR